MADTSQPAYPRLVAKDANAEFYLDKRESGALELLTRKPGGQELRLVLSTVGKSELIDFVNSGAWKQTAWKCASGFTMQLDRFSYHLEWDAGDITISRLSAQALSNALQFIS